MATTEQVSRRNRARKMVLQRILFWTEKMGEEVDPFVDGVTCNAKKKLDIAKQELIYIDAKKEIIADQ